MKTNNQLAIITLITCLLVTGIVYADDPTKGEGTDSTVGTGMGWQEKTERTKTLVTSGLDVNTGIEVDGMGVHWTFNIGSTFEFVDCCKPSRLKQSWCNYNADDPRCPD